MVGQDDGREHRGNGTVGEEVSDQKQWQQIKFRAWTTDARANKGPI